MKSKSEKESGSQESHHSSSSQSQSISSTGRVLSQLAQRSYSYHSSQEKQIPDPLEGITREQLRNDNSIRPLLAKRKIREALHDRVYDNYWIRQYDEALADIHLLLIDNQTEDDLLNLRIDIYFKLKKYTEALVDVNVLLKNDSENITALNKRSFIYHLQGEVDKSLADIEMALSLIHHHSHSVYSAEIVELLLRQSTIHLEQNKPRLAIKAVNLLLQQKPGHSAARELQERIYQQLEMINLNKINKGRVGEKRKLAESSATIPSINDEAQDDEHECSITHYLG